MKGFIARCAALILCSSMVAQELPGGLSAAVPGAEATYNSEHYRFVYPSDLRESREILEAFEALRSSIDEVFRFENAGEPLNVLVCPDKAAFDTYIAGILGDTRNQYLFLKYSDPAASHLVVYPAEGKTGYSAFAGPALNRQLYLQYLYSRVSEPPLWIRDGFQAYFENAVYDPETGSVTTGSYSPWLETSKALAADQSRKITPSRIIEALTASFETADFYPQAWSLVSFFMATEKAGYQRFINESLVLLVPPGSASVNTHSQADNTALISLRFAKLFNAETVERDFVAWLTGRKTYAQMLQSGMNLYSSGDFSGAREEFKQAHAVHSGDPMLLYYRGLVEYAAKNYVLAGDWYRKALMAGAESSTVNWALALNAIALGNSEEARNFLETARTVNPARYGDKAGRLLNSLPK